MKNLIYQHISKNECSQVKFDIYKSCIYTIQRYSRYINCEYEITTNKYFTSFDSVWDIFRLIENKKYSEEYDKILYIDADVFAKETCFNFFEEYESIAACLEFQSENNPKRPEYTINKEYFNSGIMLFNSEDLIKLRKNAKTMKEKYKRKKPGRDQLALNVMVPKYNKISRKHACFLQDKEAKEATLVHLAGRNRSFYLKSKEEWDEHFNIK